MSSKIFNSRIVQKHDTEANWLLSNFIPMKGELIVYDIDSTYIYERFKIGDGKTVVSSLPFVTDNLEASVNSLSEMIGDLSVSEQIESAIASKSNVGHTHDDSYYTESEIDDKFIEQENQISQRDRRANLLVNSNFANPINTNGLTSYTSNTETITGWISTNGNGAVTIEDGAVSLVSTAGGIFYWSQTISQKSIKKGEVYTAAVCDTAGQIITVSATLTSGMTAVTKYRTLSSSGVQLGLRLGVQSDGDFNFMLVGSNTTAVSLVWAAMYEGSYESETFPMYPQEHIRTELLDCGVTPVPDSLLANGNMANPVNQRGATTYTGANEYTIDRWFLDRSNIKCTVQSANVKVETTSGGAYATLVQKVANIKKYAGKTLTFAAKVYSNVVPRIYVRNNVDNTSITLGSYANGEAAKIVTLVTTFTVPTDVVEGNLEVLIQGVSTTVGDYINIHWAALYEGAYDLQTLPTYQPKKYSEELLECQQYFLSISASAGFPIGSGTVYGATNARISIPTPIKMRAIPTITVSYNSTAGTPKVGINGTQFDVSGFSAIAARNNSVQFTATVASAPTHYACSLYLSTDGKLTLSADL